MKTTLPAIIRGFLSTLLVYGVYTETGLCTAIFAALVLLNMELSVWVSRHHSEVTRTILDIVK
jgi:hypothetical protein